MWKISFLRSVDTPKPEQSESYIPISNFVCGGSHIASYQQKLEIQKVRVWPLVAMVTVPVRVWGRGEPRCTPRGGIHCHRRTWSCVSCPSSWDAWGCGRQQDLTPCHELPAGTYSGDISSCKHRNTELVIGWSHSTWIHVCWMHSTWIHVCWMHSAWIHVCWMHSAWIHVCWRHSIQICRSHSTWIM